MTTEEQLKAIEAILNRNIDNKLSPELGTGIYLTIKEILSHGEHTRADSDTKTID